MAQAAAEPEQQVQGHRAERHQGGQPQDSRASGSLMACQKKARPGLSAWMKTVASGNDSKGGKPAQTDGDQQPFNPDRFMGHRGDDAPGWPERTPGA